MPATRQPRFAVSYWRYSNPQQEGGDSAERQARAFAAFCEGHGLVPWGKPYGDEGRSGFSGEHRKGDLGRLIGDAQAGRFPPGTVVVVEAWDRLGRLRPDVQTALVAELLRTGVSIGVGRLNDIFAEEDFGTHKWTAFSTFAMLSYQESKQKSERVRAAWQEKKRRARAGECQKPTERMGAGCRVLTGQLPAWVRREGGRLVLVPEKAEAVRLVFRLAAEGYGVQRLATKLTRDGVPPLNGKPWDKSYVQRILKDRRAVGEFQPKGAGRKPEGEPVQGYFPAAVSEAEYDAARARVEARTHSRCKQANAPVNLFARLLVDARDGKSYFMGGRKDRGRTQYVLANLESAQGRAPCRSISYPVFEAAVLALLREIDPRAVTGKDTAPDEVAALEGALSRVETKAAKLQAKLDAELLKDDPDDSLARDYRKAINTLEGEAAGVKKKLISAREKAAHPLSAAWDECKTLAEAVNTCNDPEAAKLRLRVILRRVVQEMRLLVVPRGTTRYAMVQVAFAAKGISRMFFIRYRPPHANKVKAIPGRWWAGTFLADALGEPDYGEAGDLGRAEDAIVGFIDEAIAKDDTAAVVGGDGGPSFNMVTATGEVPAPNAGPRGGA